MDETPDHQTRQRGRLATEDVSTLIAAVCYGDLAVVLESSGLNPNLCDSDNCSLLHWAALNDRLEIATVLLERGAKVNAIGGLLRETPLHWALRRRYYRMMDLLITHGADIQIANSEGRDAVHLACTTGGSEMIQLLYILLHWGADPNTTDSAGDSALHVLTKSLPTLTASSILPSAAEVDAAADAAAATRSAVRLLIKFGANPCMVDSHKDTAVHVMAKLSGYEDLAVAFDLYQQPGAEKVRLAENADGHTPYKLATRCNNDHSRQLLLDALFFNVTPYWCPAWVVVSVILGSFWLWSGYGPFSGLSIGAVASMISFRWLVQWEVVRHRSRAFVGCGLGWASIVAASYLSVPVSLSSSLVGLGLLMVALLLSLRFNRARPEPATSGREELLAEILASAPVGTGDEDDIGTNSNSDSNSISDSGSNGKHATGMTGTLPTSTSHPPPRLCATCLCDKRLASAHCLYCGVCVQGQDFHSFFFGNCVAAGTRRIYLAAIVACGLSNLHFAMTGWATPSLACRWPLLLCSLLLAFNCAAIAWSNAVLVSTQTTYQLLHQLGVSGMPGYPGQPPAPSFLEALSRLRIFLVDGDYDVVVGGAKVRFGGGGRDIFSRAGLHRLFTSAFSFSFTSAKEERESREWGPTGMEMGMGGAGAGEGAGGYGGESGAAGGYTSSNATDVESGMGGAGPRVRLLHQQQQQHHQQRLLLHYALSAGVSVRKGLGANATLPDEPEYGIFAPPRVIRAMGRPCHEKECGHCGPQASSVVTMPVAAASETMIDR